MAAATEPTSGMAMFWLRLLLGPGCVYLVVQLPAAVAGTSTAAEPKTSMPSLADSQEYHIVSSGCSCWCSGVYTDI